jgi:hypothetical protein
LCTLKGTIRAIGRSCRTYSGGRFPCLQKRASAGRSLNANSKAHANATIGHSHSIPIIIRTPPPSLQSTINPSLVSMILLHRAAPCALQRQRPTSPSLHQATPSSHKTFGLCGRSLKWSSVDSSARCGGFHRLQWHPLLSICCNAFVHWARGNRRRARCAVTGLASTPLNKCLRGTPRQLWLLAMAPLHTEWSTQGRSRLCKGNSTEHTKHPTQRLVPFFLGPVLQHTSSWWALARRRASPMPACQPRCCC